MNYTQLTNAIKSYTENSFPDSVAASDFTSTDQIDTFIRQAEQRVHNTIQLLELRKNVTGNATANNKYLTVPSDWLSNFSLAVIDPVTGEYEYLLNKDVNFIREAFPFPAVSGKPTHYAMFDQNSYILGPTPDADYEMELHYFYYPPSIVDAGTSWLGDNFDSVLLYGALLEAYTYMKGEADVIGGYQKRYDDAMVMLKQLGEGKNRQDMYRNPQVRYEVR
ncbi:hypothetical protein ORI99_08650 [Alishewanella sp. SMS9]|jgi:hypothetical protein|nr:hypothetical protein [Alishewanella sp. SMS9]